MKRGHKVAGFGRNNDKITELRKKYNLNTTERDELLLTRLDILDEAKVNEWCSNIIKTHGVPDLLLNNAGSTVGGSVPVWELEISKVKESFNVHLIGSILLIKAFVPKMRDRNSGIIINIASWASKNGVAELSPYVMSKYAVEGLTSSLAKELIELNPTMAAISVSPGWVNTGMLKGSYEAVYGKEIGLENGNEWAEKCCDWLLKLNHKHNGMSLGPPLEKESMKKYCDFVNMCGIDAKYENYIHPTGFENEPNESNESKTQHEDKDIDMTKTSNVDDTTTNSNETSAKTADEPTNESKPQSKETMQLVD